jgi:YidC/Oxa1 family membrane protein insertase
MINMFKSLTRKSKLMISGSLLLLISGCAGNMDSDGNVLPERIISASTQFSDVWANESWFSAFFVFPLAKTLNFLQPYIGIALAITAVTIAIHLLTFGLTVKSTVATQKMQMIQPEIAKIQKKYEGKKDEQSRMQMGQEMQGIYAKHKINPFGTLLTSFIQLPVIIAMWQAVQRSEAVVDGSILGASLKVTPLSGIMEGQIVYIVIFGVMGILQFLSMQLPAMLAKRKAKQGPKRPNDTPAPNSQKGIMYGMWAMIMFISISWPTAMSLYWLVSAGVRVAQTLFIQWRYIN